MLTDIEKQKIREEFKKKEFRQFDTYNNEYKELDCEDEIADYWLSILDKTIKSKLEAVKRDLIEQAEPYDDAKWHNKLSIETIKTIINKHK